MSNKNPFNHHREEDAKELYELLDRLEKREKMDSYRRNLQAFTDAEEVELIAMEEEDDFRLTPDRFNPTTMPDEQLSDLLVTDEFDTPPTAPQSRPRRWHVAADATADATADEMGRRNPFKVLWAAFSANFPRKEDTTPTKVRKFGFFTSLTVMLIALIYLAVDLLMIPMLNARKKDELVGLYHPEQSQVEVSPSDGNYPAYMLASFKDLYDRNDDVRGWISFHASGKSDFLNIEYPIVYSGDNEEYLRKDFDGKKNRNGTLFFDEANRLESYKDKNRSLIVYGHNMASGQMFAGLNKLLGNVNNARAAATLTMSTLFRAEGYTNQYQVFAVILTDESDKIKGHYFNTRRTAFTSDAEFLEYVNEMRARSLFDYPVEVKGNDQILVLSTCTGKTSAKVKDGRLVVVARRVREGEKATVDTASIVKNTDVIMPYYWYINQNKQVHQYYVDAGVDYPATPNLPTSSTTVIPSDTTTGTADGDTTTTTGGDDTTTTTDGGATTTTVTKNDATTSATTQGATTTTGGGDTTSTTKGKETTTGGATTTTTAAPEHQHTFDGCEDTTCNGEGCDHVREAEEHHIVKEEMEAATCEGYGQMKCVCDKCSYQYTEAIDPIGHTYGEDGKCTVCGAEKPAEPTTTE